MSKKGKKERKFKVGDYIKRPKGRNTYKVIGSCKYHYQLLNLMTNKKQSLFTYNTDDTFIIDIVMTQKAALDEEAKELFE